MSEFDFFANAESAPGSVVNTYGRLLTEHDILLTRASLATDHRIAGLSYIRKVSCQDKPGAEHCFDFCAAAATLETHCKDGIPALNEHAGITADEAKKLADVLRVYARHLSPANFEAENTKALAWVAKNTKTEVEPEMNDESEEEPDEEASESFGV